MHARRKTAPGRTRGGVAAACLGALLVASCGSPATDTSKAAHDGLAATATARQALDQSRRDRSTPQVLGVTLQTAATELSAALASTASVVPEDSEQRRELAAVQHALGDAASAVAIARAPGGPDEDVLLLVRRAEDALRRLVERLGPPR